MTTPISSLSAQTPATPKPEASAQVTAKSGGLSSDFQTFLEMLTAQARYQDPLEPIDSTEYAAQLAQFSMVEQQVKTNDMLSGLAAGFGASNVASLSGWIGMDVRAPGPVAFDGTPITLAVPAGPQADAAFLVVQDAQGNEVQRSELPAGSKEVAWAGVSESGAPLPGGTYDFRIETFANGQPAGTRPVEVMGQVVEAQIRDGETVLILRSGQEILASSVTALRQHES